MSGLRPLGSGTEQDTLPPAIVAGAPLHNTTPTPDSPSDAVPVTAIDVPPVAPSSAGLLKVMVPGMRSILSVTLVLTAWPEPSVTDPVTTWPVPSVRTVTGGLQVNGSLKSSTHSKDTVTTVLFQPALLGMGQIFAVIVGSVVSVSMV
jgi:hypothetical protein